MPALSSVPAPGLTGEEPMQQRRWSRLTRATSGGKTRQLSRAVAVLTAVLVASAGAVFAAAAPAAAKAAPGPTAPSRGLSVAWASGIV